VKPWQGLTENTGMGNTSCKHNIFTVEIKIPVEFSNIYPIPHTSRQGWLFAMAKSIFAGTVENTGENQQKLAKSGKRGLCYWY
jgi:hypothetical protein